MKQCTLNDQTAKLIELGFEKPKSIGGYEPTFHVNYEGIEVSEVIIGADKNAPIYAYSIGELIELLPENSSKRIRYVATKRAWIVDVDVLGKSGVGECYRGAYHPRLIDALYDMVVKLKEEG